MVAEAGAVPAADVLGAYIRAQRQLADLSLRQLAQMSKVSNAYLSQIERGLHQPSLKVLRAIADALDLSGESLLSRAGLIEPAAVPNEARNDVEAAILADESLTAPEKQVLAEVYRTFRSRRP